MNTIPNFTQTAWNQVKNHANLHPGLLLYRLAEVSGAESKHKAALERVVNNTAIPFAGDLAGRLQKQVDYFKDKGWAAECFDATLDSDLAIGLGIPSQSKNGFSLDHTHGVPVIPGSSLKGVTQEQALMEAGWAETDDEFIAIFGAQSTGQRPMPSGFIAQKGGVVFFDAIPVGTSHPFAIDIINPHYGQYYADPGTIPPADYLKPKPIFFLIVKKGVTFRFALAAREVKVVKKNENGQKYLIAISAEQSFNIAKELLKDRLISFGVGGKTGVGYGIFKFQRNGI